MKKLWSSKWAVASGSALTVLALVALMAAGVLPVKTEKTTVVREKSAATAAATSTVALTSTAMTPAQIYEEYSAGVVEVLATFGNVSSMSPYGPSSSSAQALGSGFVVSADGSILSNAHVVSNAGTTADSVKVVFQTQSGDGTDTTTVAAINEGNSGGPLIDTSGQVIGINEQIASQSGGNQGLGFAVPINTAVSVKEQLQATGKVTYAYLGLQGQTITSDIAGALGLSLDEGVLVAAVSDGSPAATAGIKGGSQQTDLQGQVYVVGGDVLTAMDGEPLASIEELGAAIMKHKAGDTVTLTMVSGGKTSAVKVTLAERPSGA